MKKHGKVSIIFCVMMFVLIMLAGCGDTPLATDSIDEHNSPASTPSDSGNNPAPTPSDSDNDLGTDPTEPPFWAPPPIPIETLEIDPTQTGELVIYPPPFSLFWLDPVINLYKEVYPNVDLIIEDLGNDFYAYGTRVSAELMAGTGPDIIFPALMFGADMFKMADAGAFLDLNELIEQDDSFNLDDYIKPVMDGGIYRGKRYIMPFSYTVNVMLSTPSKLNEIGFDISQMDDPLSFINEVVRTLPKAQENSMFQSTLSGGMWIYLLTSSGTKYIDFETNTVLPNEEFLEDLVKAYKPYRPFDHAIYDAQHTHLLNGTVIFGGCSNILDFIMLGSQLKTFGDIQMNVIPDISGNIRTFNTLGASIRASSDNNQNAWNFIKLLLSQENQSRDTFQNIPVHKNSIIAQIESKYNYWDGAMDNMVFTKLSADEIQTFIDMVININQSSAFHSSPADAIFLKHIELYYKDEITYDDAIARVRNDLNLYLSE
ncbi:MAG: extracellular solute-binding protein [Oscillospiraceae bacterium]|nr:extracellular solute-binding protein [Oscillospiraceae bacterium]